ncbi:hypothetical protein VOLCADRAFT_65983 [Volvox carteri f. nagariensis]|uniref:EF-hand domain-containing protein n=1 Tax=Volvox carteri f. nagariensis TaxID=3068 RepID=D8UA91_VOLCA|nr:uncharacterized protein VOLCADRAFT_65983 [Volvox carteri f. nagariensis]EFJ43382.1 hypothetical protein VOLCADRAFT_65983 [Volvox carteri f. nagariensis]|eukprot:XP_002955529.1 hypothetical protein VOLCADRAFT_65983 [Volvox carteri f. nagariensis]
MRNCFAPVNQAEIEALYKRFRALDRGHKGYISPEEFLSIPELSINPVAQRLVRYCECPNFTTFVEMVAPFSPRASREDKLAFMFAVYDVDGDGFISREDMSMMLKQLAGSTLSEEDRQDIIGRVLVLAGGADRLDYAAFQTALSGADLAKMVVEVPVDL